MKKIFVFVCCAVLVSMSACTSSEPEQVTERQKYLVTQITWYDSEDNHREAYYEYDNKNRLVSRVVDDTYYEQMQTKHRTWTDTYEYENDRLARIHSTISGEWSFTYDKDGRLVQYMREPYLCVNFGYHNGRMDSIYTGLDPKEYTKLEYDAQGNVIKAYFHQKEYDMIEQPTGNYIVRIETYDYDNHPRPYFNTDECFAYNPSIVNGASAVDFIDLLSQNNMTSNSIQETFEYTYHAESGLPKEIYIQFADVEPIHHPTYQITYRKVQ